MIRLYWKSMFKLCSKCYDFLNVYGGVVNSNVSINDFKRVFFDRVAGGTADGRGIICVGIEETETVFL